MDNKKLAVITAIDSSLQKLLFSQLCAARDEGYEVHCISTKGDNFEALEQEGFITHDIRIKRSFSPLSDLKTLWNLFSCCRKERFDIVHTHTPKVSLLGQLAAKFAGVPVIINTVHGYYFHEYMPPLKRWFYIAMEWVASRCSTFILSQNPEDIETAVKLKIAPRERFGYLGNGIDLSEFDPNKFDSDFRKQKRKEIDVPEDAVIIGIVGRLVREKGFIELFEAFQQIMKKHKDVWLLIVGPEEPEKNDRISGDTFLEYGIESRVRYLGMRGDIEEIMSCMDIYTLPSWREGFPRSAIEAAAMGLPIVTTNIRGCRQVVTDGKNGLLVARKSVSELASALEDLIKSEEKRLAMGQNGLDRAKIEFDEKRVCRDVLATYERFESLSK